MKIKLRRLTSLATTGALAVFVLSLGSVAVAKKPAPPVPPPSYPQARAWHAFTGNGSTVEEASRLYLLGGSNEISLSDFWYYRADLQAWTLAPSGRSAPGPRAHAGLSCGAGQCVTSNGFNIGLLKETWRYSEANASWSKLNCNKNLCPSARMMPVMAYDPARSYHLLFGGLGPSKTNLNDTFTFAGGKWTQHQPSTSPAARRSPAAAFVPADVNEIVLFGGQFQSTSVYCDMWSWNGTRWQEITATNGGPCLHSHSMAWDGNSLIVAGGYVDTVDTSNAKAWRFYFDTNTSGHWVELDDTSGCYAAVPAGAVMAYDRPGRNKVFFGGVHNGANGSVFHDETIVCD